MPFWWERNNVSFVTTCRRSWMTRGRNGVFTATMIKSGGLSFNSRVELLRWDFSNPVTISLWPTIWSPLAAIESIWPFQTSTRVVSTPIEFRQAPRIPPEGPAPIMAILLSSVIVSLAHQQFLSFPVPFTQDTMENLSRCCPRHLLGRDKADTFWTFEIS